MDTATVTGDARASAPTRTGIGGRIPAGGGRMVRAAGLVAGIGLAVLADHLGWWWVTPALGVAIGVFARRWWVPLWCLVAGLLVWGGDLAVQAAGGGIGRVARVTGALVGLGPDAGSTVVAVTVVFGVLLCLAGGWLGAAVRSLVRQTRRQPPQSSTVDSAETPADDADRNADWDADRDTRRDAGSGPRPDDEREREREHQHECKRERERQFEPEGEAQPWLTTTPRRPATP